LLDLTAEYGVVPGLGQRLGQQPLRRGPAVLVIVDLAQTLEQPRPLGAGGNRADGPLQQQAGGRGVASQQVIAGRLHASSAALVRPIRRGQRARLLTQGRGPLGAPPEMRTRGRFPQRGRAPGVGAVGGQRQVAGTLLTVGNQLGQAAMQLASLAERRSGVQRGGEQRMGEPDPLTLVGTAPAFSRYETYVGMAVDDPAGPGRRRSSVY